MRLQDFRQCRVCGATSASRFCPTCALVAGLAFTAAVVSHLRTLIEFARRERPFFHWL